MDGGFKLGENDQKIVEWFRQLFKGMGDWWKEMTTQPLVSPDSIMGKLAPEAMPKFLETLGLNQPAGGKKGNPAPPQYMPPTPQMPMMQPPSMSQASRRPRMSPGDLMMSAYKENLGQARGRTAPASPASSFQKAAEAALRKKLGA